MQMILAIRQNNEQCKYMNVKEYNIYRGTEGVF